MQGIINWWKGLTSAQKFTVLLIIVVLVWIIRNSIKGAMSGAANSIQNLSETAVLQANGIKASYSDSTYKSMATKLFDAMDGYGTDEDVIFEQFDKLKNDVDFIKLDKAFGVRTASDNLFGMIEPTDLKGWIRDDLSPAMIANLNARLKSNGVTKRV